MLSSADARILDANANRAREGLRVVEEYARFALDAPILCTRLKQMRHDFAAALERLTQSGALLRARDTAGDVGTVVQTAREGERSDCREVAQASIRRLQEALRALEEYGKIDFAATAAVFEQLRYRSYELEKELFADQDRKRRLKEAQLYVIVTDSLASCDAITAARESALGGADIIQMREKHLEDGAFLTQAEQMRDVCRETGALFIINDRPHIAALIDADGIHTGQGDLPVHLVRRILGSDRIIGKSTSAPEFLQKAYDDGADYVGTGPVYETQTKEHRAAVGLGYIQHAAEYAQLPTFAIGSINRETLGGVLEAGAPAVAVCTAVIGARDIAAEARWFKDQISAVRA